jgi:hypothetical protein
MLYSFPYVSFYLKVSNIRFLTRKHVQCKMWLICTLFSKNYFSIGFSDGVSDEAYAFVVIAQGECCKTTGLRMDRK